MGEEELDESAELDIEELKRFEQERADILLKLERLGEKSGSVKKSVFQKVKQDYEDRLAGLTARLEKKRRLISREIMRLRDEAAELEQHCESIRDELEEIDLRHSIEEYDDASYESKSSAKRESLKQTEGELGEVRGRLELLDGLVPGAAEPAPEETPEAGEPAEAEEVKAEGEGEAEGEVEGEGEEGAAEEVKPAVQRPAGAPPGVIKREEFEEERGVDAEAEAEAASGGESGTGPALTCPKCGASNRPDSWYCEKCGAELMGSTEPASSSK